MICQDGAQDYSTAVGSEDNKNAEQNKLRIIYVNCNK